MKVKESHWHEAAKEDQKDAPKRTGKTQRNSFSEQLDAAGKLQKKDSPAKEEKMTFADNLDSSPKTEKPNQRRESAGEERSDDQKNDKKHSAREKDVADNLAEKKNADKYDSSGNQTGGGQSGFGMNSGVNELNLTENFAARSILHIADLERLVSTVRTQIGLGGKRETTLKLKNSVLEGLEVKIITDPAAGVQIEFLAANETVRAKIEKHSAELAQILSGRGINLETLKTTLSSGGQSDETLSETDGEITAQTNENAVSQNDDLSADNTFAKNKVADSRTYNA